MEIKPNNWMVVCLLTHDTVYELEFANHLLPSLQKFNLPYHIEVIDSKGSWLKNVAQKPGAIYNAMEKYPTKDIVMLDADCEIKEFPIFFNNIPSEYDISFHTLDWNSWYCNNSNVKELLSGTMFLRNNEKIKKLVEEWYFEASNYDIWEQKALSNVLDRTNNINAYPLPIEYIWINNLPNGQPPNIKPNGNIIIEHFQASRQHRKKIK